MNQDDRVNVCMSPGKLVPGAPGSALLNSRGYFVRVKCVTAHAQSIKSRGPAAHASAIKRGVMSSTLRTLRRRRPSALSLERRRSINVATTLEEETIVRTSVLSLSAPVVVNLTFAGAPSALLHYAMFFSQHQFGQDPISSKPGFFSLPN